MPTPIAQSKIFALRPPCPAAVSVTLALHLLEDARRTAHERRLDDRQVLHDPGQVAVHRGGEPEFQLHRGQHLAEHMGHRQPQVLHVVRVRGCSGPRRPCPRRSSCRAPAGRPWAGRWCPRCRSGWPGPPGRSSGDAVVDDVGFGRRGALAPAVASARPGSARSRPAGAVDVRCGAVEQHDGAQAGQVGVQRLRRPAPGSPRRPPPTPSRRGCRRRRVRWSTGRRWWSPPRRTGSPDRTGSTRSGWSRRSRPAAAAARRDRPARRRGRTPGPWSASRSSDCHSSADPVAEGLTVRCLADPVHEQVPERLCSFGQRGGHETSSLTGRTRRQARQRAGRRCDFGQAGSCPDFTWRGSRARVRPAAGRRVAGAGPASLCRSWQLRLSAAG